MQRHDAIDLKITGMLRQFTEREIAKILLSIQRDPIAYPLAANSTEAIRNLARRELELRRENR